MLTDFEMTDFVLKTILTIIITDNSSKGLHRAESGQKKEVNL